MFCEQCGKQMPDDSVFCPNCGAKSAKGETVHEISAAQEAYVPEVTMVQPQQVVQPQVIPPTPVAQPRPVPQPRPAVQPVQQQVQPQYIQQPIVSSVDLNKPISILGFMGTFILLALPIVGLIMMFVWAFGSNVNKNKKNLAIALLIFIVIEIIIGIVMIVLGAASFTFLQDMIDNMSY